MSKGARAAEDRRARRLKEQRKRSAVTAGWARAIKRARHGVAPVLAMVNALDGDDGRGVLRAAAYIRDEDGGGDDAGTPRDVWSGAVIARELLIRWRPRTVGRLLKGIEVGAEYYVTKEGDVDLGVNYSAGTVRQLVALRLGYARSALRDIDSWDRRVKRCVSPNCKKWFFDAGRKGTQLHCCAGCANAHQQLRRSANYARRRRTNRYTVTPCGRC
jgi:hypothetical protein